MFKVNGKRRTDLELQDYIRIYKDGEVRKKDV